MLLGFRIVHQKHVLFQCWAAEGDYAASKQATRQIETSHSHENQRDDLDNVEINENRRFVKHLQYPSLNKHIYFENLS